MILIDLLEGLAALALYGFATFIALGFVGALFPLAYYLGRDLLRLLDRGRDITRGNP